MAAKKKKLTKKVASKAPAKVANRKNAKAKAKKATPVVAKKSEVTRPMSAKPTASSVSKLITPLDDRIVVVAEAAKTKTAGGLFIPDTVAGRPSRGEVLAKGRGRRNKKGVLRPLDVNVGDQILFAEFSGSKILVGGNEVLILREEDVLGVVI